MTATTPTAGGMSEGSGGAIVQVSDFLEAGPVNRVALDLAAAIQRFGGNSKIISGGGLMVAEAQRAGVDHETISVASSNPIGNLGGKIAGRLDEWNSQLVHSHGEDAAGMVFKAISKHRVPHVVSLYDLPVQRNGKGKRCNFHLSRISSWKKTCVPFPICACLLYVSFSFSLWFLGWIANAGRRAHGGH